MSSEHDRRLIEDYLLIEAISKEASREKSVRKGHISILLQNPAIFSSPFFLQKGFFQRGMENRDGTRKEVIL